MIQKKKTPAKPIVVKKTATAASRPGNVTFVFARENYILLLAGLGLIVLGFILMIGGGSDDPNQFSEEIFSFRRMTLAPLLVLAGYVVEIYAIMRKPRTPKVVSETSAAE